MGIETSHKGTGTLFNVLYVRVKFLKIVLSFFVSHTKKERKKSHRWNKILINLRNPLPRIK